jgi:hypothetical protein
MLFAFQEDFESGARRVHHILLDMADVPCEAKCVNRSISAMCIKCSGHNDVFPRRDWTLSVHVC